MKFTDEEREKIITALEKRYDEITKSLENNESMSLYKEKIPDYHNKMQGEREHIKEFIHAFEQSNEVELNIDLGNNDFLVAIICLVAMSALFTTPKDGE